MPWKRGTPRNQGDPLIRAPNVRRPGRPPRSDVLRRGSVSVTVCRADRKSRFCRHGWEMDGISKYRRQRRKHGNPHRPTRPGALPPTEHNCPEGPSSGGWTPKESIPSQDESLRAQAPQRYYDSETKVSLVNLFLSIPNISRKMRFPVVVIL